LYGIVHWFSFLYWNKWKGLQLVRLMLLDEFTLVLGAGYEVPVSPTVTLDFTGGFNVVSDANHITLRAGAKFAL
jgi:hypothetical protein